MSRKRTNYSAGFKSKRVLEVLKNEKTLAEIASANNKYPSRIILTFLRGIFYSIQSVKIGA